MTCPNCKLPVEKIYLNPFELLVLENLNEGNTYDDVRSLVVGVMGNTSTWDDNIRKTVQDKVESALPILKRYDFIEGGPSYEMPITASPRGLEYLETRK